MDCFQTIPRPSLRGSVKNMVSWIWEVLPENPNLANACESFPTTLVSLPTSTTRSTCIATGKYSLNCQSTRAAKQSSLAHQNSGVRSSNNLLIDVNSGTAQAKPQMVGRSLLSLNPCTTTWILNSDS